MERPKYAKAPRPPAQQEAPSPRRLARARQAIERERASWGLFRDQVDLETPAERLERLDAAHRAYCQRLRDAEARAWILARAILRRLPEARRDAVVTYYNGTLPACPYYLLDALQRMEPEAYNAAKGDETR